jgi:hypothetical protein
MQTELHDRGAPSEPVLKPIWPYTLSRGVDLLVTGQ